MSDIVVVVDTYPQVSETFIDRQVRFLKADLVTRKTNAALLAGESMNHRILTLEQSRTSLLINWYRYALKISSRLLGTPTYYWYPYHHQRFEKFLTQLKPKVVLAQFGPTGINCYSVCRKLNIPLVIHFHGYDASQLLQNKFYKNNLRRLCEYVSRVVVVNEDMAHKLHQIGFNPDKIINIPYGVPMNEFRPVEKDFNDVFRFLSVGRFVPKKSPLNTVKAFEHCADHNPNVALTMIGDGPLFEQAACYIEKSKHKDKIRLEGAQPQAIVREALDKAHVFVQHSVTSEKKDTEGWPVAIAEACACALPVVATAHAGIKDQIVHGETGYLVPEGSFIGMGEYMLQFSRNADLCRRMGKQGRQYMEKYGDFRLQAEKLKTVLTASYSDG